MHLIKMNNDRTFQYGPAASAAASTGTGADATSSDADDYSHGTGQFRLLMNQMNRAVSTAATAAAAMDPTSMHPLLPHRQYRPIEMPMQMRRQMLQNDNNSTHSYEEQQYHPMEMPMQMRRHMLQNNSTHTYDEQQHYPPSSLRPGEFSMQAMAAAPVQHQHHVVLAQQLQQQVERHQLLTQQHSQEQPQAQPPSSHPKSRRASLDLEYPPQDDGILVPLRKFLHLESNDERLSREQNELILRKTTVVYGIVELLRAALQSSSVSSGNLEHGRELCRELCRACTVDNFAVRICGDFLEQSDIGKIEGVEMLKPSPHSLKMITPSFSSSKFLHGQEESDSSGKFVGEYLEVEVTPTSPSQKIDGSDPIERMALADMELLCHSLGILVYNLFVWGHPALKGAISNGSTQMDRADEPLQKKSRLTNSTPYIPLLDMGFSSSLHLLVEKLLHGECTLRECSEDLHLLILDPTSFLFERYEVNGDAIVLKSQDGTNNKAPFLRVRKSKLYGREKEVSMVTDMFCRVASSGVSEALLIGGYSGSGKSRLVESVCPYVDVAEGFIVTRKFDEIQRANPLSVVTSAFNELCNQIKKKSSKSELEAISQKLASVFGTTNFSLLSQALPNISMLCPSSRSSSTIQKSNGQEKINDINSNSISFMLKLFMRVVSCKEKPVMIFLDDLQWTDSTSLSIIADILNDIKGSSCLFFIGAYRNNEVSKDHAIFEFMDKLTLSTMRTLQLDGMNSNELNSMISDSLCMLPRHCKDLSDAIHKKTNGPLFAIEFLRSLVDRKLLNFSYRKRCWTYNLSIVGLETVTDNVLHLMTTKILSLSGNIQQALKVASCFGIFFEKQLVDCLSSSAKYSNIGQDLRLAASCGYIEDKPLGYKFPHDKVREAAYSLIKSTERDSFHFSIGMELFEQCSKGQEMGEMLFQIADQINRGSPCTLATSQELRVDIAKVNFSAGKKAMARSDFSKAKSYFDFAKSLLPENPWSSDYSLSIQLCLSLGNAAYSCGDKAEAEAALTAIITNGRNLGDKLDAYYLMNILLNSNGEPDRAFKGSLDILSKLGEDIPSHVDTNEISNMVGSIQMKMRGVNENSDFWKKEADNEYYTLMQFYCQAAFLASFGQNPSMFALLTCRLVDISLEHGLSKYAAAGFGCLAAMLCGKFKSMKNGYRIGKIGLALVTRFDDPSQLHGFHLSYYGFVAFLFEPIQSVAEQLRRGMDIGMSAGDPSVALLNGLHFIQKAFAAGRNLLTLLDDIEYQLKLSDLHKQTRTKAYLSLFEQTINHLIDKENNKLTSYKKVVDIYEEDEVLKFEGYQEVVNFHRAIQSFWAGHNDRCHYFASKSTGDIKSKLLGIISSFYHGLAAIQILRKKKHNSMKKVVKNALATVKELAALSSYNYENKFQLLTAELSSVEENDMKARIAYDAAIETSRASKLVNETGLACELAGRHCERFGEKNDALKFYREAKQCYADWGSQMKIDCMDQCITRLSTSDDS